MIELTQSEVRAHAVREYPRECCGLMIVVNGKERYLPCRNVATTPQEHFVLHPEDYATAEDLGDIVAVVHSHPDTLARPSDADRVACEASQLRWYIVHVSKIDGTSEVAATEILSFEPEGFEMPLVGRPFAHGILDCYSLIRDYYAREMKIMLPDFDRRDNWWNNGENLYLDNFAAAGCAPILGGVQIGDIILMQIRSPVPNHAGVYIGDGKVLHHVYGRMSSRDVYDGYWQENTRMILRHKDAQL